MTILPLALLTCGSTEEPQDSFARDCEGWCSKTYECGNGQDPPRPFDKSDVAGCLDFCIDSYELGATDLGPACQDAYVEAMACLSTISCPEYLDENFGPDDGGECDDVLRPYFDLCPGVFFRPRSSIGVTTMPATQQLTKFLASLAFVAAFSVGAGACEDEKDDPLYQDCLEKIAKTDNCMNQVWEGCDGCEADCADRGHDIASKDEHCGKLFAETYACIAALSCDDFLKWYSHPDPKKPFPCQTEETAFRTDCPDFHLYNDNN